MMSNSVKPTMGKKLSDRIALVGWRDIGVQQRKRGEEETISREEIEGIFQEELRRERRANRSKPSAASAGGRLILKN